MKGSGPLAAEGAAEATWVPPPARARARSPMGSSESGLIPAGPLALGATTTGTGADVEGVTPAMGPPAVGAELPGAVAGIGGGLAAPALPARGALGSQSLLRR